MNILTTNGFLGRFVTDWAGPDALIQQVAIRLGAPNYPGDTMTFTGEVTGVDARRRRRGRRRRGERTELGDHVTGT